MTTIILAIGLAMLMFSVVGFIMGRLFAIVKFAVFAGVLWIGAALSTGSVPDFPISPKTILSWAEGYSNPIKGLGNLTGKSWDELREAAQSALGIDAAPSDVAASPRRPRGAPEQPARNIQRKMDLAPDYF